MDLVRIHHVRFRSTNIEETERFSNDFGLITVERNEKLLVMKTSGSDVFSYLAEKSDTSGFIGFAFEVATEADLLEAGKISGSSDIEDCPFPGGGKMVSFTDPDGFIVNLIYNCAHVDALPIKYEALMVNTPQERIRFGRAQATREFAPAQLFRLGHIGLFVKDFAKSCAWYEKTLGLMGSDTYHLPNNVHAKIVGFYRLNRGTDWVDHHVIGFMQRDEADCHHISFEVQDYESQFVAHSWLDEKGYESVRGVGRHPHGSHVFDMWRDPATGWNWRQT